MGWQAISYYAYGMILSPKDTPHQDVLLGLQHVASERIHKDPSNPNYVTKPLAISTIKWIGCDVGSVFGSGLPIFPPQAPIGAWLATDPYVAPVVVTPPNAGELATAKAEWEKFETWCYERGVDIRGHGQLLVVNDYD